MVIVQVRYRTARLVADGREAVHRRHGGMDPVRDAVGRMAAGVGQVHAGGVAPDAVQREQAHVRGAVTGALAAAAAGQAGEVGLQGRQLVVAQEIEPGAVAAGQRPVHRGFDETVVVVVAGIVDRPAGPRMAAAAPLRIVVVPDVPHRLLGVGRPARALAGGDAAGAGGHGGGDVGDHRADLKVRVTGNGRASARGDGGFGGGDLLFDHPDGQRAVLGFGRELIHQGGLGRAEAVAAVAGDGGINPSLEARIGGRTLVDLRNRHGQVDQAGARRIRTDPAAAAQHRAGVHVRGRETGAQAAQRRRAAAADRECGAATLPRPACGLGRRRGAGPEADDGVATGVAQVRKAVFGAVPCIVGEDLGALAEQAAGSAGSGQGGECGGAQDQGKREPAGGAGGSGRARQRGSPGKKTAHEHHGRRQP